MAITLFNDSNVPVHAVLISSFHNSMSHPLISPCPILSFLHVPFFHFPMSHSPIPYVPYFQPDSSVRCHSLSDSTPPPAGEPPFHARRVPAQDMRFLHCQPSARHRETCDHIRRSFPAMLTTCESVHVCVCVCCLHTYTCVRGNVRGKRCLSLKLK